MPALRADEKPPDSVFQQSPLELTIKTPPFFKPTRSTTGYLPTPVGNVPYRDQSWMEKRRRLQYGVSSCLKFRGRRSLPNSSRKQSFIFQELRT